MRTGKQQLEFLVLLAFTQVECGRYADAAALLAAVLVADPDQIEASRLLALAQLRSGAVSTCLTTLDHHQRRFGLTDKHRQLTWIRIRALHAAGRIRESRDLIDNLRVEIAGQQHIAN